jgi:hypothetical protein
MAKPGHIEFNFIHIVQSLGADDLQTGSYLDQFAMQPRIEGMKRSGIDFGVEVSDIATAADLFAFLARVQTEVETLGRSPLLHFEIHGSSDQKGLMLRSSEFVPWTSLLGPLTEINRATGNNLLLTLATCHGVWLGTILLASRPAPFRALIGPSTSEFPIVLFPAFEAFYQTLLDELDGGKAIRELLVAASAKSVKHSLSVIDAERIFSRSFRRYVEETCNPEAIARRVAAIIAEGKQRSSAESAIIPEAQWEKQAAEIAAGLADTRSMFEEYRRRFFMIDIWPENDERFALTYDEVVGGA